MGRGQKNLEVLNANVINMWRQCGGVFSLLPCVGYVVTSLISTKQDFLV